MGGQKDEQIHIKKQDDGQMDKRAEGQTADGQKDRLKDKRMDS